MVEKTFRRGSLEEVGYVDPPNFGIRSVAMTYHEVYWPIQDLYAVSTHVLIARQSCGDLSSNWLEPVAVASDSIYVFDFRDYPYHNQSRTAEPSLQFARNLVE